MKIKKLGALLVSAALCAGMAAPAFAFEGDTTPVEQPVLPEVVEDVVTQGTRGFVRDGDNIFLHDFRQNRLLHRDSFALKGKGGSRHASAQCRRYQQRTQFLNLHLYRPPSQKLHPRQTAQPGSGWRLRTAAAEQQAVPV